MNADLHALVCASLGNKKNWISQKLLSSWHRSEEKCQNEVSTWCSAHLLRTQDTGRMPEIGDAQVQTKAHFAKVLAESVPGGARCGSEAEGVGGCRWPGHSVAFFINKTSRKNQNLCG